MRERQDLDDGIKARRATRRRRSTTMSSLIELGEAEGDAGDRRRGRGGAPRAGRRGRARARSRRCCRARPTPTTPISKSMPAPAAPRARTGRTCCCACTRAGPSAAASRSRCWKCTTAKRPASSRRRILIKGHNAYGWLKTEVGRAPPGAHLALSTATRAATPRFRQRLGLSGHRRHDRDRDQRSRTCASTPTARRAPAASTSTRPTRPCASPTSPTGIAVACQAGALAAQEPRQGLGDAALAPLRGRAEEARGGGQRRPSASKTDIGWGHQIRSYVLQPYQLVKDLRTGVESTQPVGRARRRSRRVHGSVAVAAHRGRRPGRSSPTSTERGRGAVRRR